MIHQIRSSLTFRLRVLALTVEGSGVITASRLPLDRVFPVEHLARGVGMPNAFNGANEDASPASWTNR